MTRRRSVTTIKAALALALSATLLVLANSSSAQSAGVDSDKVVQSLKDCDLGETRSNFHVLFLLDESGSLGGYGDIEGTDPENKRVDGTVKALDALETLAIRDWGIPININVAIHGFDEDYQSRTAWSPLGDPGSLAALTAEAEEFRVRNRGGLTHYLKAIEGATKTLLEHELESGEEGCKALVWFTDGEYDTEKGTNNFLSSTEIDEITNDLCAPGGPVDQLRENDITVIAIGLSNQAAADPPDMALVKAIASGEKVFPRNADLNLNNGKCGTLSGTGNLYETTDPDELIEKFAEILGDSLFETVERPPDPIPCGRMGAEICTVEFELGPWVDRFTAYFKLPPRENGRGLTVSLNPPDEDTDPVNISVLPNPEAPLKDLPGFTGESPSLSWRKLTGTAAEASDFWDGVWQIQFEGPGADEAKANLKFIEGDLKVRLDPSTLDRTDPGTFGTIGLVLESDSQTFNCDNAKYPIILEFTGSMGDWPPMEFRAGEPCLVPDGFLLDLLTAGPATTASDLEFKVTPSLRAVADDVVPPLEFGSSQVQLDVENALVADLTEGSKLDRTKPDTYKAVGIELKAGGRTVGCSPTGSYPIILEFTGDRGDLPPASAKEEFEPGQPCIVPSEFLHDLVDTGPGKDALSVSFEVTPSLKVDGAVLAFSPRLISIPLQDALVAKLAEGSMLDRTDSASFENVHLELFLGDQKFEASDDTKIALTFIATDLSGRPNKTEIYGGDGRFTVPSGFLEKALLGGPGRSLVRFSFEVTPEIIVADEEDLGDRPNYGPSTIDIWLHDPIKIQRVDNEELDREDSSSYDDVKVNLLINGEQLSDRSARVTLDYTAEVGGKVVTKGGKVVTRSGTYEPGEPSKIPSGFFTEVFQATEGTNLVDLAVDATPTLTIDGRDHPGYVSSRLYFAVRAGDGFPIYEPPATATDLHDTENSTLTVVFRGPNDGTGTVEIRSISGLPTDLPGTITLVERTTCEIPSGETLRCEVELDASFTANRIIKLDVNLTISGTDTKVTGETMEVSVAVKPLKMTRPLNTVSFITTLLKLLALFLAVQTALRVVYTTRLARWQKTETGSRRASLPVRIAPDGSVTAEADGNLKIEPTATLFATELETEGSSAQLDELRFWISWWQTFIGERQGTSLIRYQRPTIRVESPDAHCIASEGCELGTKDRYAIGKVGTGFTRCWVLQIPDESLGPLASEDSATGRLLVVLLPAGMKEFDEQMEDIRDVISDVTSRELPRLLELTNRQAGSTDIITAEETDRSQGEGPSAETGESDEGDDDRSWDDSYDPLDTVEPELSTGSPDPQEYGGWTSESDDPLA